MFNLIDNQILHYWIISNMVQIQCIIVIRSYWLHHALSPRFITIRTEYHEGICHMILFTVSFADGQLVCISLPHWIFIITLLNIHTFQMNFLFQTGCLHIYRATIEYLLCIFSSNDYSYTLHLWIFMQFNFILMNIHINCSTTRPTHRCFIQFLFES